MSRSRTTHSALLGSVICERGPYARFQFVGNDCRVRGTCADCPLSMNQRVFPARMFNMDPVLANSLRHYLFTMRKKKPISLERALAVRCPTCSAAPREKCELSTGLPRTNPHRERKWASGD